MLNLTRSMRAVALVTTSLLPLVVNNFEAVAQSRPPPPHAGARIVVVEGEDAVNIVQLRAAVAPLVEVRDHNNLPVAGVPVTFAITGSGTAAFAGGASTFTVATNAAGQAIAAGLNPVATGAVQINVTAALHGQTLAATITQTNVLTAAQAANLTGAAASTGGGGVSTGATTAIVGGVAAGAAAAVLGAREAEAPAVPAATITVVPGGTGIRDVTLFSFTANGGPAGASYTWDLGDGTTATGPSITHSYPSAGTFNVTLKAVGSTGEMTRTQPVTVDSLSGTWVTPRITCSDTTRTCPITYRLVIVQQSGTLFGRWEQDYDPSWPTVPQVIPDVQPLSGSVSHPRNVTVNQEGQCQRTFTTTVDASLRQITATMMARNTACLAESHALTFTRQ